MARFEKGKTGNPDGRPKGAPNRVTQAVRDQVVLDADVAADEARVCELVIELPRIQSHLAAGTVQRIIVVPGKLANIVVR